MGSLNTFEMASVATGRDLYFSHVVLLYHELLVALELYISVFFCTVPAISVNVLPLIVPSIATLQNR